MLPGPANVLLCPFCGGEKRVMTLASGNTFGGTVWSDTRRDYPMMPEVSPIQQCPHCGKYYFIEQASSHYEDDPNHTSFLKLGKLSFSQLLEAKKQMNTLTLTKMQRWILNHQFFLAYNDTYRRNTNGETATPTDEERELYDKSIQDMLDGIEENPSYELFHAELLRETCHLDDAARILKNHKSEDDKWMVEAMLRHIKDNDTEPFLLIYKGEKVK